VKKRALVISCVVVFAVALIVRLGLAWKMGMGRPMESDSHYYLQLATSLAHGQGYVVRDGFWPNVPSMQRLPGWPCVIAVALRVLPFASGDAVMRVLCVAVDSLNALLIAWLAWKLFAGIRIAVMAGLAYALHPSALFLTYNGESEPLFVLLCLGGFLAVLRGGPRLYLAALLFGLACLVRVNYVLWVGAILVPVLLQWVSGRRQAAGAAGRRCSPEGVREPFRLPGIYSRSLALSLVSVLLFSLPSLLWAVRNYHVCGHFPVLSTLRGQTFYGGNNPVVANTMELWGYWVFPDAIPGESKAAEMARTMSEYDLDVYYFGRGKAYVAKEWFSLPRLVLGKLIRAYVPVPWKPNWLSYGVGGYRLILYGLSIIGLCWFWKGMPGGYRVWFAFMVLINVFTVAVFWGCFRFAFALEPFLLPFAAAAVSRLASHRGTCD
jgi:hypothetical protein